MFVPRTVSRRPEKKQPSTRRKAPEERKVVVEDLRSQTTERREENVHVGVDVVASASGGTDRSDSEDDSPVVSYGKHQRWPVPGEPVCVVCGRYGAYIVDRTDQDVCSLECKARHLRQLGLTDNTTPITWDGGGGGVRGEGEEEVGGWRYVEHPEMASWSERAVEKLRTELSITVQGREMPRPITSLHHLPLSDQVGVHANLKAAGYSQLTPVQMQAIPAVLTGRDVMVCASTGSGKTLSFLLPLILRLLHQTTPTQREEGGPRVVVLTPTRELSMQIEEQAQQIVQEVPSMKTALIVGGLPIANQIYRLKSGVQLVIATPARLLDVLKNHAKEIDTSAVEALVFDEVDSLLQLGFEQQVQEVEENLPSLQQKLFYSATIPPQIEKMAAELLEDPLLVTVGEPTTPNEAVHHSVLWVEEAAKKKRLFVMLEDKDTLKLPIVVFVNSKAGTLLLAEAINKKCPHLAAVGIHGDMAQERRSDILKGFLDGKYSVIVATGVLARGLDLRNVQQVFIFDMPSSVVEFIHQIGRAGRLGTPGWAITFINEENKGVFVDLVELLQPLGVQLPVQLLQSPHLAAQREKRRRKRNRQATRERGKRDRRDFYNQETLMDLIKKARKV